MRLAIFLALSKTVVLVFIGKEGKGNRKTYGLFGLLLLLLLSYTTGVETGDIGRTRRNDGTTLIRVLSLRSAPSFQKITKLPGSRCILTVGLRVEFMRILFTLFVILVVLVLVLVLAPRGRKVTTAGTAGTVGTAGTIVVGSGVERPARLLSGWMSGWEERK